MSTENRPIGLLYTGGTIGMEVGPKGLAITSDAAGFEYRLRARLPKDCPRFERLEAAIPLMDSSNAEPADWLLLARLVYQHRDRYSGFVLLTGTDTMAYTASALSFLLDGLNMPVVLTGSQRPLGSAGHSDPVEQPTDAVSNVTAALRFCASLGDKRARRPFLSCVFLAFDGLLLRGNCARKVDSRQLQAFLSPNLPPVGRLLENRIRVEPKLIYRTDSPASHLPVALEERFSALEHCEAWNEPAVASCFLLPGAAAKQLESAIWPDCKALLLFSYGFGNIPSADPVFIDILAQLAQRQLLMLNITQCVAGGVGSGYEAGHVLQSLSVVSGGLVTPEAAFTKLHLFAHLPELYPPSTLGTDICGEQIMPF